MAAQEQVVQSILIETKVSGADQADKSLQGLQATQDRLAQSTGKLNQVQTEAAQRFSSVGSAYDRLLRTIDPTVAAQAKLSRATSIVDRAFAQGKISIQEHGRVLDQASAKYAVASSANDNLAKSTTSSHQSFQIATASARHFFDAIASGAGPVQALGQQIGHLTAIASAPGGLSGLLSAIPRGLIGAGGALAVGAAGVYAFTRGQQDDIANARAVNGVGRRSGLTPDQIKSVSGDFYGGAGGLSRPVSEEVARGIASVGGQAEDIRKSLAITRDLSATLDQSFTQTGQTLKELFRDPVKGFDQLDAQLGFATAGSREFVKALADQGHTSEAARATLDQLTPSLRKYADSTTTVGKAFDTVKTFLRDTGDVIVRGTPELVRAGSQYAESQEQVAARIEASQKRERDAIRAATEESVRLLKVRADAVSDQLDRDNQIARRNPLDQAVYQAQREAGVAAPITAADRRARSQDSLAETSAREAEAAVIRRQVLERNTIDIGKSLTEQSRTSVLTLESEILSVGKAIGEIDKLRYATQARIAASAGGKQVDESIIAQIDREATAYAKLTETLARTKATDQIRFDRGQLGRDTGDQGIATQLRSQGLGTIDDPKNASLVSDLRNNAQLSDLKSSLTSGLSGLFTDLAKGGDLKTALRSQVSRLLDKGINQLVDQGVSGLFKASGLAQSTLSSTTTATMNVTASVVNITGGAGLTGGQGVGTGAGGSPDAVSTGASTVSQAGSALGGAPGVKVTFPAGRGGTTSPANQSSPNVDDEPLPRNLNTQAVADLPSTGSYDLVPRDSLAASAARIRPPVDVAPQGSDSIISGLTATGKQGASLGGGSDPIAVAGRDASNAIRDGGTAAQGALSDVAGDVNQSGGLLSGALGSIAKGLDSSGSPGGGGLARLFGLGGGGNSGGGGGSDQVDLGSSSNPLSGLSASDYGIGFASGGYTGQGGRYDPAGIVHRGEFVVPASTVTQLGASYFNRYMPGYADGGFVTGGAPVSSEIPMMPANNNVDASSSVHYAPTYHITPAGGVTAEQLGPILDARERRSLAHLQRNFGAIGADNHRRYG